MAGNVETFIATMWICVAVYAAVGAVLCVLFHVRGIGEIDGSAKGASIGFHVLVTPGLIALWPIVLRKWLLARRGGQAQGSADAPVSAAGLRRYQSVLVKLLAVALPVLVALAIWTRPAAGPAVELPPAAVVERD